MTEDWENEEIILDVAKEKKFDDEKEEIEKKKYEPVVEKPKEEDKTSYEYKWREKNKEIIEKKQQFVDDLKKQGFSEKEIAIKIEEKRKLDDVDDFLDIEKTIKKKVSKNEKLLETEQHFTDLANKASSILKNKIPTPPSKYLSSFLKETIEQLGSGLDMKTINDLLKDLTKVFNEKRNKESGKSTKAKSKKPKLASGKGLEGINSQPVKEYEYQDEYDEEFEEDINYGK